MSAVGADSARNQRAQVHALYCIPEREGVVLSAVNSDFKNISQSLLSHQISQHSTPNSPYAVLTSTTKIRPTMPSVTRRFATLLLLTAGFLTIFFIASLRHPSNDGTSLHGLHNIRPQQAAEEGPKAPVAPAGAVKGEAQKDEQKKGGEHGSGVEHGAVPEELLHGHVIAPKLGNETAK